MKRSELTRLILKEYKIMNEETLKGLSKSSEYGKFSVNKSGTIDGYSLGIIAKKYPNVKIVSATPYEENDEVLSIITSPKISGWMQDYN